MRRRISIAAAIGIVAAALTLTGCDAGCGKGKHEVLVGVVPVVQHVGKTTVVNNVPQYACERDG